MNVKHDVLFIHKQKILTFVKLFQRNKTQLEIINFKVVKVTPLYVGSHHTTLVILLVSYTGTPHHGFYSLLIIRARTDQRLLFDLFTFNTSPTDRHFSEYFYLSRTFLKTTRKCGCL